MLFEIVTLFPDSFESFFKVGLMGRAVDNKIVNYNFYNPRDNGLGSHQQVDDYPFGGGMGMLLRPDVMQKTLSKVKSDTVILMSPRGEVLNQTLVDDLTNRESLGVVCGQYEGIDNRFVSQSIGLEVSIGDYILNSGETAAKVLIESIARKKPGFMKKQSHLVDSFSDGLLECDQFTRPFDWKVKKKKDTAVPPVLINGDTVEIEKWGKQNALFRTWERRPDLLENYCLDKNETEMLYVELINRFNSGVYMNVEGEYQ